MAQDGTDLIPEPSSTDHIRGRPDAPVVITEFGDFECPYCGEAYTVLESILEKYGSRVALVFRHFPLPMHSHAAAAAEAAETAASVGKFWEMYDRLYRHQKALTVRDLSAYAEAIGVDAQNVRAAVENETYRERIEHDVSSGEQSAIEGTPALFINGFAYDEPVTVEALGETIDRILATLASE